MRKAIGRLSGLLIVAGFALLTVVLWGYANRPTAEPAWPGRIQGFAFQPYQKDQDAIARDEPTVAQIDAVLACSRARPMRSAPRADRLGRVVHHRRRGTGPAIFEEGYDATYIPQSYGRGVMPDNFLDFKKQRSRWRATKRA